MGEQPLTSGQLKVGETVRCGYYDQRGLEIEEKLTVLDFVVREVEYGETAAGESGLVETLSSSGEVLVASAGGQTAPSLVEARRLLQRCELRKKGGGAPIRGPGRKCRKMTVLPKTWDQ